ncbi:MAG: hypothetical protein ABIP56_06310 [Dokdonella sp.]
MKPSRPSPHARLAMFVGLVVIGFVYIAIFVWLKNNSVDFVERNRDAQAAAAAAKITSPEIDWSFEQGSSALALFGMGWRAAAEGSWSRRKGGDIFLPSSVAASRVLRIQFDGHLNPPEREVTVSLDANGEMIGQWRLTRENLSIFDEVRLPALHSDVDPWRLRFVIERPSNRLWRGYEPGLLIYGIYLRSMSSQRETNDSQPKPGGTAISIPLSII